MAEQKEHGMSLSEKEQQELLEKYDPEAGTRKLAGWAGIIAFAGLLSFSLFQLYTAIFGVFPAQIKIGSFGICARPDLLLFPATKNLKAAGTCKVAWYDAVLAVLGAGVGVYWVINYETIVTGIGLITTVDFYVGLLAVLLVLEATRRAVGLPITIIAGLFLLYGLYGSSLPGFLSHNGLTLERLIQTMYFTTEGILGTPLAVSSTFIFLFILFGAFLVQTGVGQYFNDLAVAVAGRSTGDPPKWQSSQAPCRERSAAALLPMSSHPDRLRFR